MAVLRRQKGFKRVTPLKWRKATQTNIRTLWLAKSNRFKIQFDNGNLVICGICSKPITERRDITIDHIFPRSKGGSNYMTNLQPAHRRCNNRKGSQLMEELRADLTADF